MKLITASDFVKHWMSFSKEVVLKNSQWEVAWNSNAKWSKLILGTKGSSDKESPIGNYFQSVYPKIRYRTEDALFDLSLTFNQKLRNIPTLDKNYNLTSFDDIHYASVYDILLEHENEIYISWHEVAKLAYVRSYLKVLVTYFSDGIKEVQRRKEKEMMIATFESVISQCNKDFPDHPDTEYVLLIGYKNSGTLQWTSVIFDWNGNPK
ncbi:MAG: hypothetical protein Fur0041_09930 [Bacteroidia bacterium]